MDATKLSRLSFEELEAMRLKVEREGRITEPNSFWLYDKKARKKLSEISWAVTYKLQEKKNNLKNTGKGNFEQKDPSCIGKDGEPKAPEHYKAAVMVKARGANNVPMVKESVIKTYYVGREEGKPQGKYVYLSEDKEYAKNFGGTIFEYNMEPKKTLDLTSLKENSISFERLNRQLKTNGIIIERSIIGGDEVYKPAWQWIRKYPEIAEKIKSKGFDSIKQHETFLGKGKTTTTIQVLDNSIIKVA